jgi:hypothetical protein
MQQNVQLSFCLVGIGWTAAAFSLQGDSLWFSAFHPYSEGPIDFRER